MIDRDLRLGFRALEEGIIRPDQLREALAECFEAGDRPLALVLEARGWASFGQLGQLELDLDRPTKGESTSRATPPSNGDAASSVAFLDPNGSTASLLEPTTRPWAGPPGRSRSVDDRPSGGGRYQLLRVLGIGGLGKVWLARDVHLGREVALKELRDDRPAEPALVHRFVEEARITSRLEHPGIVSVYDMVEQDGESRLPFYTMRFLAGRTLAGAVEAYHRRRLEGTATTLEFRGLLDAFTAVCLAVAFAHSREVFHRDLKGSNVILGDFGEVFVIDWGLAKSSKPGGERANSSSLVASKEAHRDDTAPGSLIGTPGYIAPELVEGEAANRRSDVYSLGAILYLILAGRPSYVGAAREVIRALVERDPEPPRALVEDSPAALEAVCLKAMARDPSRRYGSAGELAEEVRRWLADEPVRAHPEPLARRLARWARKHRAAVMAASAVLASAVVILSVATVLIWREQGRTLAQKVEAVRERVQAENNLVLARNLTVDLLRVADGQLSPIPGAERARAELFDGSRATFRNFLLQKPTDPFLRYWTARTGRFSANVHQMMNESKVAESTYIQSIRLLGALADEYPYDLVYGGELALALADQSQAVARVGRLREAAGLVGRSVKVAESLAHRFEGRSEGVRSLAGSLNALAAIEGQLGRPADSALSAAEAVRLYEQLLSVPASRTNLADQLMMGSSLHLLAVAGLELGRRPEGLAAADRAVDRMRSILEKDPALGNASYLLARCLIERARTPEDLDEAVTILDRLAAGFRLFPVYRERAAEARRVRGASRAASGALELAEGDLEGSRQDFESLANTFPEFPGYLANLGRTYLEQGRLDRRAGRLDRAVGRFEQAVRALEGATEAAPEASRDRASLAEARDELSRVKPSAR